MDTALAGLFGDVSYNTQSKQILFYNKDKSRVIATLDATPFVKDESISNVYISNGQLVVTFNSGRTPITVPMSSVFNPNLYYTRSQLDTMFNGYFTKAQINGMINTVYEDFNNIEPLFVPVVQNGNTYTSNVDFGVIRNAIVEDNRMVVAVLGGTFYHMFAQTSDHVLFSFVSFEEMTQVVLRVNSNNEWVVEEWIYEGGSGGGGDLSDYYTKAQTNNLLGGKVDKETGKGLSTNDYTTAEKEKLAGLQPQIQSDWNQSDSTAKDFIKNKPTIPAESVWLSLLETNTSLILSLATSVFNETDGSIIISDNASLPKAEIIETSTSITIQQAS